MKQVTGQIIKLDPKAYYLLVLDSNQIPRKDLHLEKDCPIKSCLFIPGGAAEVINKEYP